MRLVILRFSVIAFISCICLLACEMRPTLIRLFTPEYEAEGNASNLKPEFSGPDASRPKIKIALREVASGFKQITDIQFLPGKTPRALVALKSGEMHFADLAAKEQRKIHSIPVLTASEQGLLGIAIHPDYNKNKLIFLNYSIKNKAGKDVSRVESFRINSGLTKATPVRVIMDVEQPFANHNAGQLAFGPDGMLYIGWGDGGWRYDPENHGQRTETLLGAMLRIDVNVPQNAKQAYRVPPDNPFVTQSKYRPEIFAIGLRNPWRYSFDPQGRLIVADVGQDKWEEVSIVPRGANMGWKHREAFHCFDPEKNCKTEGLTEPVYEYPREEGRSITGGFVYTGNRIGDLENKYIFADFMTGRIWAIDLPEKAGIKVKEAHTLGKWPILISTFGRDNNGEVYAGDFGSGKIYRLAN